eukprot:95413_1
MNSTNTNNRTRKRPIPLPIHRRLRKQRLSENGASKPSPPLSNPPNATPPTVNNEPLNNPDTASPTHVQSPTTESAVSTASVHSVLQTKPPPPAEPAPDVASVVPLRWRPDMPNSKNISARIRRGRMKMNRRSSRMSETARRMLGLMSVMMAGRAQGVTTGIFAKQMVDVQTGLDGNVLLQPNTNIAVRTVGRGRLSKRGCVCPCKCNALPRYVANGRVFVKNQDAVNAPAYLRDFLIEQRAFMDCVLNCDVVKQWTVPENLLSGIYAYVAIKPTEYTWKLKLKRQKFEKIYSESNGEMEMPETDRELYDMISSDEEMESDQPWKSPEMLQAELCICLCSCNGAPLITAPTFPVMKYAVGYKKKAAKIHFDAPLSDGGSVVSGYQVTSIPGNIIKTGATSPIKVKGLNIGVWYQFVVRARNRRGLGPPSVPSNPIRIAEQVYVTELQNALRLADRVDQLNKDKKVWTENRERREVSRKTIIELENEDLSDIIETYKGKHKLNQFSLLRTPNEFYKKKIFGRKDNMLSFERQNIPKSLTKLKNDEQMMKLSLDVFDDILIFQNVKQDGNKMDAATHILEVGKSHPILRDEIYSQMIKQITDCDDSEDGIELVLGFKLFYICLSSFNSSKEMSLIILSKLCQHAECTQSFVSFRNVPEIATNCIKAWKKMNTEDVRMDHHHHITRKEISQILYSKANAIRLEIYLPDDTRLRLKVDPFCTMDELTKIVCNRFGLSKYRQHLTLKIIANVERFTIETNSNAFRGSTQVAHWYGRWKDIVKKHPLLRYKIILFEWKYKSDAEMKQITDAKYIHFVYSQCKLMVNNGQIPIGVNDCALLASLSLIIDNKGKLIARHKLDKDVIIALIPYSLRERVQIDDLIHEIFDAMKMFGAIAHDDDESHADVSMLLQWESKYVEYLSINVEMYSCSFFNVSIAEPNTYAKYKVLLLGVNWNTLFVCKDERTVLDKYGLQTIQDLEANHDMNQIIFNVTNIADDEDQDDDDDSLSFIINTEFVDIVSRLLGERIAAKMTE